MKTFFQSTIVDVGAEVPELMDGGILILYGIGAPSELAEISVLHLVEQGPTSESPPVGASLSIGAHSARLTAIGERAWAEIAKSGHVVINFNGAESVDRPGDICAATVDTGAFSAALVPGSTLTIAAP